MIPDLPTQAINATNELERVAGTWSDSVNRNLANHDRLLMLLLGFVGAILMLELDRWWRRRETLRQLSQPVEMTAEETKRDWTGAEL